MRKAIAGILIAGTALSVSAGMATDPAEIVAVKDKAVKVDTRKLDNHVGGVNLFGVVGGPPICFDALLPGSVSVSQGGRKLEEGREYLVSYSWGRLGTFPDSPLKNGDEVQVSFSYRLMRIDSLARRPDGTERLVRGLGALNTPLPPDVAAGELRAGNFFVSYSNIEYLPVKETAAQVRTATTKGSLSKTMEKLRSGAPLKIVCWGDSVTFGEDVSAGKSYPPLFEEALKAKFPKAAITLKVVAVSGSRAWQWLEPERNPYGGRTDRCRWEKVAAEKPDLITMEFVNDAGLNAAQTKELLAEVLKRVEALDAELVLISPHLTVPAWTTGHVFIKDVKPRAYDNAMREFAVERSVSIADANARWMHLALEGIPYPSLLRNSINHPDERGHLIFVEELMKVFE